MKVFQRTIVVRMADGNDYTHKYPHVTYENITEFMREQGELFVFELAQQMFDSRQRGNARFDAVREAQTVDANGLRFK